MEILSGISTHGQGVFAEYLLLLLNPTNPRHRDAGLYTIGMFAGIPAPMDGAKAVAPKEIRDRAIQEFQATLRDLVNRWIESGKQGEGEQPWTRSVRYGAPESIEVTVLRFWKRHLPQVLFTGEEQSIFTQGPLRHSDWVHLAGQPENKILAQARDYAIGFFASLMDSPSRYRIFKCGECGSYFTKERMPKKGVVIKSGSYCERCRGEASKRRVEQAREKRLDRMIGWAADAASMWKPERRFGSKADWVAKQVSKKQPASERPVQKNWYAHHQNEIELEVKRRMTNAEG